MKLGDISPQPDNSNELLLKEKYVYNPQTDTYITFLKSAPNPISLSGETHRAMKRAYSNWDGQPSTINEICRRFSFPRPWFVEYKQTHGWTHDAEPFSAEEVKERPVGEMVEDALQMRRQVLFEEFEKAKWDETKKAAEKWWEFEQTVKIPLENLIQERLPSYQPPLLNLRDTGLKFAVVFPPYDVHYGKAGWEDEVGQGYSRQECRELLLRHTEDLAKSIAAFGKPEKIIMPVGSDFFHVDTPEKTTTKGTPQDVDGSSAQIYMEGCELALEHCDMVRQIAPIELLKVPGNHDYDRTFGLFMFLFAAYRNATDVTIRLDANLRQFAVYGSSLMGFEHGDSTKYGDLSSVLSSEKRKEWGDAKHCYYFTGHLHHEITREIRGITHFQVRSLSGVDRWHSKKGYITSGRALQAYVVSHEDGVIAQLVSPVRKDDHAVGVRVKKA